MDTPKLSFKAPTATPVEPKKKPNVINDLRETLTDRFKRSLNNVKRIARGTVQNIMGAGDRWDKIQADKNENYFNNLPKETQERISRSRDAVKRTNITNPNK